MNYIQFKKEMLESELKSHKQLLLITRISFFIQFMAVLINSVIVYNNHIASFNAFCIGISLVLTFITTYQINTIKNDIRYSTQILGEIEENQENENIQDAIKQHENAEKLHKIAEDSYNIAFIQLTNEKQKYEELIKNATKPSDRENTVQESM